LFGAITDRSADLGGLDDLNAMILLSLSTAKKGFKNGYKSHPYYKGICNEVENVRGRTTETDGEAKAQRDYGYEPA
jgi:hypothetical protein